MVTKKAAAALEPGTGRTTDTIPAPPPDPDDPNRLVEVTEDVVADLVHANTSRVGGQLIATAGTITTVRRAAEMGIDPDQYQLIDGRSE